MHKLAQKSQQVALRILSYQAVISVIVALLFLVKSDTAALSALAGGLICLVPNGIFVMMTHRHGGAQSAKKIMNAFYLGEALKIALTAIMFAVAFISLPIDILPLLVTYILCLASYFLAGLLPTRQSDK